MKHLALLAALLLNAGLAGGCLEFAALITDPPAGDVDGDDDIPADDGDGHDDGANDDGDVDTNGDDDVDTTGVPALPDGATLTTTASGLQYYDFTAGGGNRPIASDSVVVNYTGYLVNGTIFDDGQSVTFNLGGVIEGFSEGIQGMQVGGRRRLVIPPDLGYGPSGNPGAGIGGDDTIIFDVDLLDIIQ